MNIRTFSLLSLLGVFSADAFVLPHLRIHSGRLRVEPSPTLSVGAGASATLRSSPAETFTITDHVPAFKTTEMPNPEAAELRRRNNSVTTNGGVVETISTSPEGIFVNGVLQAGGGNDVEEQDEMQNSNNNRQSCATANDCDALCKQELANITNTPISTCDFGGQPNEDLGGICTCGNGAQLAEFVSNALQAISQVACQVFNKALEDGVDIATSAIPGGIAETAAEKTALTVIKKTLKIAKNDNIVDFCKGINFTIVSSTILNNFPRATATLESTSND